MKTYILFLYLCCNTPNPMDRAEVEVRSPNEAAVVLWEKNNTGFCYKGKLIETIWRNDNTQMREIPIPKISFLP